MATKYVYFFGDENTEGSKEMKALLGGKGANLAEMAKIGLPVPPGFTISTEACRYYLKHQDHPQGLKQEVEEHLRRLEKATGKSFFGGKQRPLLVSVRSGAMFSMPGMMETILNLGLNDETVVALAEESGDARFAYDSYRRFVQMYSDVVLLIHSDHFEKLLEAKKHARGVEGDMDLSADDLKELVGEFKALVQEHSGQPFPEDPEEQLWGSINAVFGSWDTPRAVAYRKHNNIPDDLGTAVNICTMAFGNMGEGSATGVAFTRNPSTGENKLFGEFLFNAQGEDVVAGIRTPLPMEELKKDIPQAYDEFIRACDLLEQHYHDMQDLEFTIERGKLYMLQARAGKRTAAAAVRIAVEMEEEGLISKEEAVLRVSPDQLDQLLHPTIDPKAKVELLTTGLPASPGAAAGTVVFSPDEAAERGKAGEAVILVRRETSPEDFHGMVEAKAILTARGGMTSHAAVVARGMGKCCVAGASEIEVDEKNQLFRVKGQEIRHGDWITLDGSTGRVLLGKVPTVEPDLSDWSQKVMEWADEFRTLKVRTNADTPHDAGVARKFGAEGIGLCRTEHMFFEGDRIDAVREMILAEDLEGREKALAKLLPMQREDFIGIFRAMEGLPVTIRTLDPPLHEFLPHGEEEMRLLGEKTGMPLEKVRAQVEKHHEFNPMLGHRGCRLGITYPEITRMQARAIFEAALAVQQEGKSVLPEIMIPLVGTVKELQLQKQIVLEVAKEVLGEKPAVEFLVGTMIELPRAAVTADEIAAEAQFFSFGTNDLTQTTLGLSRDDAGRFLPDYVEQGILPADPFQSIDVGGVGKLVETAVKLGRQARPDIKLGICGEHGGDPASIHFFNQVGLAYVSCSPYRVPIARLAAAQAAIKQRQGKTSVLDAVPATA